MIRIAICDDNNDFCFKLEDNLIALSKELVCDFDIEIYYSGESLLAHMKEGEVFQLLFLDIMLKGADGVKIGEIIRQNDSNIQIIYMSVEASYAMSLFKNRPIAFIVKPFDKNQLKSALEQAIILIEEEKEFLEIPFGKEVYHIKTRDILYISSDNKITNIHTKEKVYQCYSKLSALKMKLPSYSFVQVHKSYLVSYNYINVYKYEEMIMEDKESIPISQGLRAQVRKWMTKTRLNRGR